MLNLARAELPIAITHDRLNTHDLLVNVQNGTLDLATGQLRPHDRGDLLTYVLPVAYDPAAVCPTWDTFLGRVMGGDGDLAGFLARAVGYTLSGLTTEQCLFFLYGRGANGKSTFIETVMALMGDLGHKARAQVLMLSERERVSNEVAALAGRRRVMHGHRYRVDRVLCQRRKAGRRCPDCRVAALAEFGREVGLNQPALHLPLVDAGCRRRARLRLPFQEGRDCRPLLSA